LPFRSKAQRRLFYAKLKRGEMSQKTIDEWESKTKGKLPERVKNRKRKALQQHRYKGR
jgi:hypothetical protein